MHNLRTEPVHLVVLDVQDAAILQSYRKGNRSHLAPWEPSRDGGYASPSNMQEVVRERWRQYVDGTAVHLCALDTDGSMVAECNFTNIVRGPFQACTLGFSVARASEGRGLMTTVVRTGVGIMFDDYGLHRIMANHMPRNERSRRVLERCGFVREGYAKAYLKIAGRWEDHILTALVNPRPRLDDEPCGQNVSKR